LVAGGGALTHALLVWFAMRMHFQSAADPTVVETAFTMAIDLSRQPLTGALRTDPRAPEALEPKLATLLPQAIPVELFDIDIPETQAVDSPIIADSSPLAASVNAPADTGSAGDVPDSGGHAGDGLVLLRRVVPDYPVTSARRGEQGVTAVLLHVAPSGRVDEVKVERGSGSKHLDKAAVEAFRDWRFKPLPRGAAPDGKWLRTAQRFILYSFTYSRLEAGAAESVYAEHLKPKGGTADDVTPGGQEALIRFMAQVRGRMVESADEKARVALTRLREALEKWGAVKAVSFTGIAGSSRWVTQWSGSVGGTRRAVEVSWNMFEVRHEHAVSEWLIAVDRAGSIWTARAAQAP
jgi:protein TonB